MPVTLEGFGLNMEREARDYCHRDIRIKFSMDVEIRIIRSCG